MTEKIKVWDPAVRLFHWSLVVSYALCYWVSDDDVRLHANAGYVLFVLLLFRILWGFVGGRFARFGEFSHGPKKTIKYLRSVSMRKAPRYIGHNPAGGWMIFLILFCLLVTSWAGVMIYGQEGKGPLALSELHWLSADDAPRKNDSLKQDIVVNDRANSTVYIIHDYLATFSLLLVLIHISGVIVASRLHRENLVKAMITGTKPQKIE